MGNRAGTGIAVAVMFLFVIVIKLAILAGLAWAGYELVTWITTK